MIEESESDLLFEGPLEKAVERSPHHHEEEAEVSVVAHTVTIQVNPGTHLVSMATGVDGVEKRDLVVPSMASRLLQSNSSIFQRSTPSYVAHSRSWILSSSSGQLLRTRSMLCSITPTLRCSSSIRCGVMVTAAPVGGGTCTHMVLDYRQRHPPAPSSGADSMSYLFVSSGSPLLELCPQSSPTFSPSGLTVAGPSVREHLEVVPRPLTDF